MKNERVYRTIDKTRWGPGQWQDEPDKVQWIDEATDLDCLAVRARDHGAYCGYVGVPESHPWHGVHYSACPRSDCNELYCYHTPESILDVHGGVTYSDGCATGPEESSICHVPFDGRPDNIWWFGWDACHSSDLVPGWAASEWGVAWQRGEYRDLHFVQSECARLAAQLARIEAT